MGLFESLAFAGPATHDTLGRLTHIEYADGSTIDYTYDADGNQFDRVVTRPVELTVTVDPPGAGTVTGAGSFRRNTTTALTATAGSAFIFDAWKKQDGTVLSTNTNFTYTVATTANLIAHFIPYAPEIAVEDSSTTPASYLADGGSSLSFGSQPKQIPITKTLTIRNTGNALLTNLSITVDGSAKNDFSTSAIPISVAPGGSTMFTVQFTPSIIGMRSAALHISSNDADENPFDIALSGAGALSANANISSLALSGVTLVPPFTSSTLNYTTTVPNSTIFISLTPGVAQTNASVRVNGIAVPPGSTSSPVYLSVGNNVITITGTAEDGTTVKTYTLNVVRAVPKPGEVDMEFFNPYAGSIYGTLIEAIATQPNGKILMGGLFESLMGLPQYNITQLGVDGLFDEPGLFGLGNGSNDLVSCIAVQTDGKILFGGDFTSVNQQTRNHLARMNADGSLESTATFNLGTGIEGYVKCIAIQPDGKILVGGFFNNVNGQPRIGIARLNNDGSLESTATFNTGVGGFVSSVLVQPDGKILLVGYFSSVNGQPRHNIARLNADGSLESTATFNSSIGDTELGLEYAHTVVLQPDGKILIGGAFDSVNGQPRNRIARLNTDGSLESTATFDAGTGADSDVFSFVVQADGKILVIGSYLSMNDQPRKNIARLNADGSLESTATFNSGTGPDNYFYGAAYQKDGKILIGGNFKSVNGWMQYGIIRLVNDEATESLAVPDRTQIAWMRGGTAPEVLQTTFELSTNSGVSWSSLGSGARVPGGWKITGLSLPANGLVRARARTSCGFLNGSSSLMETKTAFSNLLAPNLVMEQPVGTGLIGGVSKDFGSAIIGSSSNLTFTIKNTGTADLTGLGVTIDGIDAAMFSVTSSPTTVINGPNGSTTFTVLFSPSSVGSKSASLHVASNNSGGNSFDIVLTGNGVNPPIVFSDDFNSNTINPTKWNTSGNTVTVANQEMHVEQNVTDAGGILTSAPFALSSRKPITISRRVRLHYAYPVFTGLMSVKIGSLPLFGIHYENYTYSGPDDVTRFGFYLIRNNANSHGTQGQADTSSAIPALWDTWFNERLTYNPDTGIAEYFINDISLMTYNVGILPTSANPSMTLSFGAWGWYTGHYQWFDDLTVRQESSPENFYTLAVNSDHGAVSMVPAQTSYAAGTPVEITITPNPGFDYLNTTGDVSTSANHFTVTLDATKSLTANFSPTVGVTPHFTDNFDGNSISSTKWTSTGNTVSELGQIMRVDQNITDAGGTLTSTPFLVANHSLISITRRVNLHYANNVYAGQMSVKVGTLPLFGIHYENYAYASLYDVPRFGFYLTRNDANSHGTQGQSNTSNSIPALWDTWFNEKLTYNTDTGIAEYFINDVSKMNYNVGILPRSPNPTMMLSFNAWGWDTGHHQWFDNLEVTSVATVYLPPGSTASETWRWLYFGNISNAGIASDNAVPMNDSVPNLLKFATAMDPTKTGKMPGELARNGNQMNFTYTRNKAAVVEGVNFVVEWSDSMNAGSWSSASITESTQDQGATEQVTATMPAGSNGHRFIRLRVTRP